MNRDEESDSASGPIETKIYYIGGLPAEMTESDLSSFFSRYATILNFVLHRAKNPARKGFAFLGTPEDCDLISSLGSTFEILGHPVSIQTATVPKEIILTPEDRASRKVFVGEIPPGVSSQSVLASISRYAQVERLTRFKVKSDRTKYCYAIMQHLEDVQLLLSMKQLKLIDPRHPKLDIFLQLGPFSPKKHADKGWPGSKDIQLEDNQETSGKFVLPFNESLGSETNEGRRHKRNREDAGPKQPGSPHQHYSLSSQSLGVAPKNELCPASKASKNAHSTTTNSKQGSNNRSRPEYKDFINSYLALSVHHRHEISNIRFNILLD